MAKYLDKWKDLFPDTVGGTTRPSEAVSDQEEFNTDGFPQFIAQDPVNYALQNAFLKQFLSNDAWLWVKQKQANQALDDHKVDTQAHAKGISGNAGSATKLANARTINLSGAVTADAVSFDGTADATINVKTLDASKLKGTASVSTTGNAGSATKVIANAANGASANIAEASMASSDFARIRVSGASDVSELALETADNGDEAIVARQYTGIYETPVRTAKILDESGNTSFPGTVVAPKFTGSLNGNAATATKLQTARTLSLTGKAAGSATFDGSANASINVTSVNADTASKLSTARKINITGNATGASTFDGTSDVSINVTVNSATKATNDSNGANIASTYVKKAGDTTTGKITFASTDLSNLPEVKKTSDDNMSGVRFSSKTKFLGAVGKRLSNGEDLLNLRSDNSTTDVVLDSRNYGSYALPKSGGTMTGALNFVNNTWNLVGDDSYIGDHDIGGTFCVKGANGETGIALVKQGNDSDYARISYGGGNINFNKKIAANLAGNADTATTATNVSGKIYYSTDSPSVATDKLFTVKQAHGGEDNVPNNGLVIQTGPTGANYNGKLYITDNGGDGVWIGGVAAGKEVGWTRLVENKGTWGISITGNAKTATTASSVAWSGVTGKPGTYPPSAHNHDSAYPSVTGTRASGTWGISISGNAASATNADKLDGYHASDLLGKIYPVGSIYMSMVATNPASLFGIGTWKRISQGRMLLGADDSGYKAGATGGEATHTLSVNEMPAHSHGISNSGDHTHNFYGSDGNNGQFTEGDGLDTEANNHYTHNERYTTSSAGAHTHTISNAGGGAAHNNMPPYLVCYIWQRTA